jgi:hypothetical protein
LLAPEQAVPQVETWFHIKLAVVLLWLEVLAGLVSVGAEGAEAVHIGTQV